MKATGIVRHVDDLGSAAIPKEIRCTMRVCGDYLFLTTLELLTNFALRYIVKRKVVNEKLN